MNLKSTLALASALALSGTAFAMGGGGGGGTDGGNVPSASMPHYDTAVEYRDGVDALQASRFAEADRSFGHVLTMMPRDANVNYVDGLAKAGKGDLKGAAKMFEKAARYDATMIKAHQQLGVTLAKLGDPKASAQLDWLKAQATTCGDTCPQAAELKVAMPAVEAAIAAGKQARLDLAPGPEFAIAANGDQAYLTAVGLINEHRYEDAIASLNGARRAFGPHPDILTYLGFANRKLGRYDVAESYYRQALALAPHHRGATEYYGEMMVERGQLAAARVMLARLDRACDFGCAEADELRRWITAGSARSS